MIPQTELKHMIHSSEPKLINQGDFNSYGEAPEPSR
jgi:hypothetical protein